jgi:hypothetical protein
MFGPDSAIQFHIANDPRKWAPEKRTDKDGAETFVLEGDSAKARNEIVRVQVTVTQESLQSYVYTWKAALLKADPKIDFKEEAIGNDSIVVNYRSAGQTGIQRFIKGKDGVYMLTYQVRSQFKQDERLRIWDSIIRSAILIPSNLDEFA